MGKFFSSKIQPLIFIWIALKPFLLITLLFILIGGSLYAYDQYRTYQEKVLGSKLIDKIDINSTCDEIINPNENFTFKFQILNKNDQKVSLQEVDIDINLLGTRERVFSQFIDSNPKSDAVVERSTQFQSKAFLKPIDILENGKEQVDLNFKAGTKEGSGATSHTIVAYSGKIIFSFDHEITIETKCQFQVRYP